ACLVIADTEELGRSIVGEYSDVFQPGWKNYFVCQNRLLANLTHCDSSKKQANMIRMAFGSRDTISMGKDFEHFLKKSLKTLSKHGEINTKFHSKDFAGAMSYSVVLSKVKDMPLFLYMENSAHQASAIFSDATSEQLLSPDSSAVQNPSSVNLFIVSSLESVTLPIKSCGTTSKILPEALSRVGVEVVECTPPALTPSGDDGQ
ncbi:Biotin/lipoate A/B protein ligase, partial [Parelaphostrongylus tenuis]